VTDARQNISLRLKTSTLDEIDKLAEVEHRETRSDMIRALILEAMNARKTARTAGR
jgi:metal-responsive CopG/Arc/MetJ family transcriptional regulator